MTTSTPPRPRAPERRPAPPSTRSKADAARKRAWKRIALVCVVAVLLIPVLSFGRAMFAANNLTYSERAAEWMRDNNLGGVLNKVEAFWFSRNQPKAGGDPNREIEGGTDSTASTTPGQKVAAHLAKPANVAVPDGVTPVANEGVWRAVGPSIGGAQGMYTTQVRPDSVHTSILDGLVWMDPKLVSFKLHPGTIEPGGPKSAVPAQVPTNERLTLLAAFNGGFRMQDAMGGFYLDGVMHKELRDGAASFVVFKDGTATVGKWNRDVKMSPDVVAVRQNLDLIIDNGGGAPNPGGTPTAKAKPGVPAEGLDNNENGAWGDTLGNKVLVWRSAVCVTDTGALVYGYGGGLGARSLADLMLRAGCVRAMELDINPAWTTFNFYEASSYLDANSVKGTKLLPDAEKSANRYLSNDTRDFIAVHARQL